MCGIVGVIGPQEESWLTLMRRLIVHRGPDDEGEYRDPVRHVSLGMQRLSILDLEGGHQPMSNEEGSVWIVFNGEIYNAPALRSDLEAQGVRFRTRNSDTEVLLRLYEREGEDMLRRLNGIFGLVVYDRARGTLLGARDPIGVKPLYYREAGGRFAFASELKCLLTLPWISRDLNPASLYHYVSLLYVPGEDSIISGVRRLPPGGAFRYDIGKREFAPFGYWRPRFEANAKVAPDEWAGRVRDGLKQAATRQMLSDVPVACSLSGGLDSSALVGVLSEAGFGRIRTYSLGFAAQREQEWNELPLAREVARRWGTDHHEIVVEEKDLLDDLVRMVWHLDEPYGGGLPSWYVYRFMREGVKVALTGTGGDELFGSYGKFEPFEDHAASRWLMRCRRWFGAPASLESLWEPVRAALRALPEGWLSAKARGRWSDLPRRLREPVRWYYFNPRYYAPDELKRDAVLMWGANGRHDTGEMLQGIFDASPSVHSRDAIAFLDFMTQLPEEFLMATDRLSMAHSLEARVPFLDREFVELVFSIPPEVRTRRGDGKYLLKKAVGDLLPPNLLSQRKRGFVLPLREWLRGRLRPLAERMLAPDRLRAQGLFRPAFYADLVEPHLSGRAEHTEIVWAALMFQLWYEVYMSGSSLKAPTLSWKDLV